MSTDNKQIPPTMGRRHMRYFGPKEKAKNTKGTIKRLITYLHKEKSPLVIVIILVFLSTLLNILGPYLMKEAIDNYIIAEINLPGLGRLLLLMSGAYLSMSAVVLLQQRLMIDIAQKAIKNLRTEVFAKLQTLTIRYFDTHSSGDLMSRMTNDIDNISTTLSQSCLDLISGFLSIVAVTLIMILLNWQLALICITVIPLVLLSTKWIGTHTRKGFRAKQNYLGQLNGMIEENISAYSLVKAFAKEDEISKNFHETNHKLRQASHHANVSSGIMGPLMNTMNNLNYGVTAFAGAVLAIQGVVSIGTIAAFLNYTKQFSRPLNQIAQLYTMFQSALAGAERVFEILDQKPEFSDPEEAIQLEEIKGEVIIKDLHFRYLQDIPIIKGISITAEPGQTIALVGPTGAGKTTIINLLTRFYNFQEGEIFIDGVDIHKIKKENLRQSLGIVLQDTFLFSGTIMDNIRYGRLEATEKEIIEASKMANAHQFIHRMPRGYQSLITGNGASLSQGQRQLIAIARAILTNPSILILDEATSSVDTRTEIHIQEGMLKLMEGRTSFIIAHRLSTIKKADKILVMKEGQIIERGKHDQLLEQKGFYHDLYYGGFGIE
ncbi:ABC transporter ATP-binding protein [Spirochaeta cellobiosiphila]|uniref:ABC transporter ATP-binding protein n=1 Tax=Spirochaeta cellobiosiphila TaxID=504483 RepID=UPI000426C3FC|nr:ABC transporter ATP-binding protein [Spirochaeta cellobiosiphila]